MQSQPIVVTFNDVTENFQKEFTLFPYTTFQDIRTYFEQEQVVEPTKYYLAHKGKVLHKNWTVAGANISSGDTIDICPAQTIRVHFQGALEADAELTTDLFIGDLQDKLSEQLNQSSKIIYVYWNDKQLDPRATFLSLSIPNDSILEVRVEEKVTIVVRFPTSETTHEFSLYSTIDQVFEESKSSLSGVSVVKYHASFKGKEVSPTDTLKDLDVQFMDKIYYEIDISGG